MATQNPDVYQNLFTALRSEKGALLGTGDFYELDQAIRDIAGVPISGAGGYEDLCESLRSEGYEDDTLARQLKVTALSEPVYEDESSGRPTYYASESGGTEVYSEDPFADVSTWQDAPPTAQSDPATQQAPELYFDTNTGQYYDAQGNWYDQDRRLLTTTPEQPQQAQEQATAAEPQKVGDAEAAEKAKRLLMSEGIDIDATLAGIDTLLSLGATD
ncbi:MAG TPA: hypothetical protein VGM10_27035 [Actinocrinis sp.]|jgi:hypothetical protein